MSQLHLPGQLGFDDLLASADEQNRAREFERETAHLPSAMDQAVPFFRSLLGQHHAAMMAGDAERVFELREEARKLALRLNNGKPGIIADENAPGCMLETLTAASLGEVPIWGQAGEFNIEAAGTRVRVVIDGVFGIGSSVSFWHGFAAHCVDANKPFISETGYRSFLGLHAAPMAGMTPDAFVKAALETYKARELKGRLVAIDKKYRQRRD
ncbi:MAG: hypothetical protein WDO68_22120 [Gammaproteobacteria bacterium]